MRYSLKLWLDFPTSNSPTRKDSNENVLISTERKTNSLETFDGKEGVRKIFN